MCADNTVFVIEDEAHAEWCGEYESFDAAIAELKIRATIPWDHNPNICPCTNWRNCGRRYEIIKFDRTAEPWTEIAREPIIDISFSGVQWKKYREI